MHLDAALDARAVTQLRGQHERARAARTRRHGHDTVREWTCSENRARARHAPPHALAVLVDTKPFEPGTVAPPRVARVLRGLAAWNDAERELPRRDRPLHARPRSRTEARAPPTRHRRRPRRARARRHPPRAGTRLARARRPDRRRRGPRGQNAKERGATTRRPRPRARRPEPRRRARRRPRQSLGPPGGRPRPARRRNRPRAERRERAPLARSS